MKRLLFLLSILLNIPPCVGQDQPLRNMIEAGRATNEKFEAVSLLQHDRTQQVTGHGKFHVLSLNRDQLLRLLSRSPSSITLQLPVSETETVEAELMKVDNGYVNNITTNNSTRVDNNFIPQFYRGIVKGTTGKSSVALTVTSDRVAVFISYNGKNLAVKKSEDTSLREKYILYNSREISFPPSPQLKCATANEPLNPKSNTQAMPLSKPVKTADYTTACIYVFYDCDDSLYRHFNSSVSQVTNYVYEIFNQVALAYQNEGIKVKISKINVWTTTAPFTPGQLLETFASYYKENFFGNVAVCLDWGANAGAKAGISGATGTSSRFKTENGTSGCTAYTPGNGFRVGAFSYCDLNYFGNYSNFPIKADEQQVYLITHEMGHLFGSNHTQWCGWLLSTDPNVYGALDNCVGVESGPCTAGPAPVDGGTFMSYCIYTGEFVNFNNGFGQKPRDAIRNSISNSSCLQECATCVPDIVLVDLAALSTFHFEAASTIQISGQVTNSTTANLDAGSKVTFSPGFKASQGCLLHVYIDGCGGNR